ncbi:MAG: exodeoxyribonuclease VII small subunit [Candidatus Obscuribacterales bacterium]|nr:exodeoxyribonuclease VII small subunit [Candidatus Obscuribacterales bacterium]
MSKEKDFESTLKDLEKIVGKLDGEIKLEEALELFEEGIKLSSDCEKFLTTAEQKVELLKRQADGTATLEMFVEVAAE